MEFDNELYRLALAHYLWRSKRRGETSVPVIRSKTEFFTHDDGTRLVRLFSGPDMVCEYFVTLDGMEYSGVPVSP